uniref:Protein krueppel n=1 Tax=Glossina palpalis gambiensis TaxID=67801 RepID=A0A1B0ALV9_9MUSC
MAAMWAMQTMCRLCMAGDNKLKETIVPNNISIKEEKFPEMVSIYSIPRQQNISVAIVQIIKQTIPKLHLADNLLPKLVCTACLRKLMDLYKFQEKCLQSEQKYKKLLTEESQKDPLDKSEFLSNMKEIDEIVVKMDLDEKLLNDSNLKDSEIDDIISIISDIKDEDIQTCSDISVDFVWTDSNSESSDSDWATDDKKNKSKAKTKIATKINKKDDKTKQTECLEISSETITEQQFPCEFCKKLYKTKDTLRKHHRLHHGTGKDKRVTCNICKKELKPYSFKEHMQLHSGKMNNRKPYLCSECGKSFSSSSTLRQHLLRHKADRQYHCSYCPRKFPCKSDLLSHSQIHQAKPKSHICDVCGSGFSKPYLLKKHKMYHNNERPFTCEYCGKSFFTAEKLRRHTRTHTGEKPYRCSYCEKAYCQSNELMKHLRLHLGENVYQCELCPLRLPNVKILREHFASHKDDDDETRERNLLALKSLEMKGIYSK